MNTKNMKKMYTNPQISVSPMTTVNVLMASGEGGGRTVSSNVNVHGGNNSGNVAAAF